MSLNKSEGKNKSIYNKKQANAHVYATYMLQIPICC